MKSIMFNTINGLESSVLDGRKTMLRRKIHIPKTCNGIWVAGFTKWTNSLGQSFTELYDEDERSIDGGELKEPYEIGEIVAIKQTYNSLNKNYIDSLPNSDELKNSKGWFNKLYVKKELMPHHIKIVSIFPQRLQDITNDDCFKEGIWEDSNFDEYSGNFDEEEFYGFSDDDYPVYDLPKDAFIAMVDTLKGKGTWDRNDWVWSVEFELIN